MVSRSLAMEVADALAEHGRLTSTSLAVALGRPWKKIAHVVADLENRGVVHQPSGGTYQLATAKSLIDEEPRARNRSGERARGRARNPSGPPPASAFKELVELGTFLDSKRDIGSPIRLPGARLLWSPASKTLIVLGLKLPRAREGEPLPARAAKVYGTWTRGRKATRVRVFELTPPKRWDVVGPAATIGYRSDKFHERGETVDYEHKFGPGVVLYQAGNHFAWRGGKLRVTKDGIEG